MPRSVKKSVKKSSRRIKYTKREDPRYGRKVAVCKSIKREKACLRRPECKYSRSKKRCSRRKVVSPLNVRKFSRDVSLSDLRRGHKDISKKSAEMLSSLKEKLLAKLAEKKQQPLMLEGYTQGSGIDEILGLSYRRPKKSVKKSAKKSVKKSRTSMKKHRKYNSAKRGRHVAVCGRYVNPDVCDDQLDCYFDEENNKCRPRKGRSAKKGIRQGPMMPTFYENARKHSSEYHKYLSKK